MKKIATPLVLVLVISGIPLDGLNAFEDDESRGWREAMRHLGVRRAWVTVSVSYRAKLKIAVGKAFYYSGYDRCSSQITEADWLKRIQASGLADRLKQAAIQRARLSDWFAKKHVLIPIDFLDNEEMPEMTYGDATTHLRKIAEELPSSSFLRQELETGSRAHGVCYPWMTKMKRQGVRKVVVSFRIHFRHNGKPRDLRVTKIQYYDEYDSDESRITNPEKLKGIRSSGLEELLLEVALQRAKEGFWVDVPRPRPRPFVGGTGVILSDDEWLPYPKPIFF